MLREHAADDGGDDGGGKVKELKDICKPDPRYENMVGKNKIINYTVTTYVSNIPIYSVKWTDLVKISLWDKEFHYSVLKEFELPSYVPDKIRTHFDLALGIGMYAYFNWPLWDIAALKAINCYELALRTILEKEIVSVVQKNIDVKRRRGKPINESDNFLSFYSVIKIAKDSGYINEEEFNTSKEYIRKIRNMFSHKYDSLIAFPFSQNIIETCYNLICSICSKKIKESSTKDQVSQENS